MLQFRQLLDADEGNSGGSNSPGESANSSPGERNQAQVAIPDEQLERVLSPLVQRFRDKANQANADRLEKLEGLLEKLVQDKAPEAQSRPDNLTNSVGTGEERKGDSQATKSTQEQTDRAFTYEVMEGLVKEIGVDLNSPKVIEAYKNTRSQADFLVKLVEIKREAAQARAEEDGPGAGTQYGGGRQLGDDDGPVKFQTSADAYAAGWKQARQNARQRARA